MGVSAFFSPYLQVAQYLEITTIIISKKSLKPETIAHLWTIQGWAVGNFEVEEIGEAFQRYVNVNLPTPISHPGGPRKTYSSTLTALNASMVKYKVTREVIIRLSSPTVSYTDHSYFKIY